jgi:phosphatidylserine decarboxylase
MSDRVLPIAAEGWGFILVPLVLAVLLAWAGWIKAALVLGVVAGFMAFFFRDPDRLAPIVPGALIAPADGRVMEVRTSVDDPFVGSAQAVSIFLSPLDVHVNRSPMAGLVVAVEHRPGAKMAAYRPEASERNERTTIAIQGESARVVVRQIAGVLARRIVCRVRPGDKLAPGERFGLIKFGSRTDLIVPAAARLRVKAGDRVLGGETVIGVLP